MARGRMLAVTIADDKRFNEIPTDAALVYLMAIPQLDRDGLILGEPTALWGQVCRRRPEFISRMPEIIEVWTRTGLVTAYSTDDGDTILHFIGFQKNQTMTHYDREAASRFPCPPGFTRGPKGLVPDSIRQEKKEPVDEVRTYSGPTPDEVPPNVKEYKGRECNAEAPPLDPFLAAAQAKHDRRQNGQPVYTQQAQAAEWNAQLQISERLPIVEAIADITGKRLLLNAGGKNIHAELHEGAITAHTMGYTADGIRATLDKWKADWRGKNGGSVGQFLTFLSEQHAPANQPRRRQRAVPLEE